MLPGDGFSVPGYETPVVFQSDIVYDLQELLYCSLFAEKLLWLHILQE